MKYQIYPAYKDSGIEWLGDVPEHWEIKKSKHLFRIETGGTPLTSNDENFDENGIAWVKPDNLNEFTPIFFTQKHVSEAGVIGIPIIPKGSILVCGIGTVGKFGIAGTNLITNQQINAFIPDVELIDQEFAKYLIASSSEQLAVTANKVVVAISNKTSMQNISLCIPVKTEQQKIAQFLDHETAKIDTLIEKQQRLIELLKEKRQAVISHAVTKGLNPNAPMKDSGVEWLDEVPESWGIKPIKRLAELNPKKSEITDKNLMCNFVPMEKLKIGTILLDEIKSISDVYDGYTYFQNDDILMAKVTPCFENNNIAIACDLENGIGFGSTEIYVFRVKQNVANNFLFYRLQESNFMAVSISAMTGAGGLKRVPADILNNYLIAIPDFEEQKKIANFINTQTTKIDNLIEKSNSAIELMQERRTALISAAVTGKIDVRNWKQNEGEK